MWASSTANALRISCASKAHLSPAFSLSRCFSTGIPSLYSNGFSLHLYIYMCLWTNFVTKKKTTHLKLYFFLVIWYCYVEKFCSFGWFEVCNFTWVGEAWGLSCYNWHYWSRPGQYNFISPCGQDLYLSFLFFQVYAIYKFYENFLLSSSHKVPYLNCHILFNLISPLKKCI